MFTTMEVFAVQDRWQQPEPLYNHTHELLGLADYVHGVGLCDFPWQRAQDHCSRQDTGRPTPKGGSGFIYRPAPVYPEYLSN